MALIASAMDIRIYTDVALHQQDAAEIIYSETSINALKEHAARVHALEK